MAESVEIHTSTASSGWGSSPPRTSKATGSVYSTPRTLSTKWTSATATKRIATFTAGDYSSPRIQAAVRTAPPKL